MFRAWSHAPCQLSIPCDNCLPLLRTQSYFNYSSLLAQSFLVFLIAVIKPHCQGTHVPGQGSRLSLPTLRCVTALSKLCFYQFACWDNLWSCKYQLDVVISISVSACFCLLLQEACAAKPCQSSGSWECVDTETQGWAAVLINLVPGTMPLN